MTTTEVFEDFLKKKVAEDEKVDWNDRKARWIKSVNSFYDNVNKWLNPYVEQSLLKVKQKKIIIDEQYVGDYEIKQLDIVIGNDVISLIPQGTMVVGGFGRIDMKGPMGDLSIFQREWGQWKFVTRTNKRELWDATEESFQMAIQDLING